MKIVFVLVLVLALAACSGTPTPTPLALQAYPATWTPEPTPTNTPPGPTATLVIQGTLRALPTRDPNARVLPFVPRGQIGLWASESAEHLATEQEVLARVEILVSGTDTTKPLRNTQALLSRMRTANDPLPPQNFSGVLLAPDAATDADAVRTLRAKLAPRLVLASVFITDTARVQELRANADGLVLENFLHAPDAAPDGFPDEATWKKQMDTLANLSANSDTLLLAALRFSPALKRDAANFSQWLDFAFASFLLGVNNAHSFLGAPDSAAQEFLVPPALMQNLGVPQSGMVKSNGVYQRRFTHGAVFVNPTNEKRAFILSLAYKDIGGNPITTLEMPPYTGMILLNAQ